jgi:hypothetical protein
MLKRILQGQDGMVWTGLIWLRDQWRALENTVINLREVLE